VDDIDLLNHSAKTARLSLKVIRHKRTETEAIFDAVWYWRKI